MHALSADAEGARETLINLLVLAGLAPATADRAELTGTAPLLAAAFHVGVAAQASIAGAALAATEFDRQRGSTSRAVQVDMHDAERECTGFFQLDDTLPATWAPLSGLYACQDGHVRIHANFDHHRDGALELLGLRGPADNYDKRDVSAALEKWSAFEFEQVAAERGLVVAAARSFAEWDAQPHARAAALLPLFNIERIGDATPIERSPGAWPLSGIRVLDLTRILAGPVCGRTLANYGAEVLLINGPHLPNIDAIADTSRGKRSAHIDLRDSSGRAALQALTSSADVFVQGYRPGGLAARGFGPSALAALHPGIVVVSLTAYGALGPWSGWRGFDSLVQTATGFNYAEGEAAGRDRPRALPVQMLDYGAGFLMAFAAQVALLRQLQEGGSWHVQVSLLQVANWLRALGRCEANFEQPRPDLASWSTVTDSGFGRLRSMPHAARIDGIDPPLSPSFPPGTHAPLWLNP